MFTALDQKTYFLIKYILNSPLLSLLGPDEGIREYLPRPGVLEAQFQ